MSEKTKTGWFRGIVTKIARTRPLRYFLPPAVLVGFSGHRSIVVPEKIETAIRHALEEIRRKCPGSLAAISSAAAGADILFASVCKEMSIPWICQLPLPESEFKNDFAPEGWSDARELMDTAVAFAPIPREANRDENYLACGIQTVDQCEILLAVWDGKPARGTGGTAEIVTYARDLEKPLFLINPDTGIIQRERFGSHIFSDKRFDYVSTLLEDETSAAAKGKPQIEEYFELVDRRATQEAPRNRKLLAAGFVCQALATMLAFLSAHMEATVGTNPQWGTAITVVSGLKVLMVMVASIAMTYLAMYSLQDRWVVTRTTAEICRSALACWGFASTVRELHLDLLPDYRRIITTVYLSSLSDPQPQRSQDDFRKQFVELRLKPQISYFQSKLTGARTAEKRLKFILKICAAGGFATVLLAVLQGTKSVWGLVLPDALPAAAILAVFSQLSSETILLLSFFVPSIAGCVYAVLSVYDITRRVSRYATMLKTLKQAQARVENASGSGALKTAIRFTERALLSEVFEWNMTASAIRFNSVRRTVAQVGKMQH